MKQELADFANGEGVGWVQYIDPENLTAQPKKIRAYTNKVLTRLQAMVVIAAKVALREIVFVLGAVDYEVMAVKKAVAS